MATYFKCDGCGNPVEAPKRVGHVVRREYCEKCAEIADKFIAAEEELRKRTHEAFIDARAILIAGYAVDGFKLPDVPDEEKYAYG